MLSRIKELFHDSFFYGASKFLGQLVGFLLIPLYTSYLTPQDYGVTTILGIYSIVVALVANLGLESSLYNFLGTKGYDQKALDTASLFVLLLTLIFLIIGIFLRCQLSQWMFEDESYSSKVVYATLIAFTSSLATIPLTVIRLERKVIQASIFSLLNIVFSIGSTSLYLVVWNMGVDGALLGNLTGNVFSLIYLLSKVKSPSLSNWELSSLKSLIKVAIYLFPNKVFALGLPYYSQFILSQKLSIASLGLYAVAWKFCTPLSLIFNTFSQAWGPYKFKIFKDDKDPKSFFSGFLILFVGGACFLYLITSVFGDDILRLMTPPEFHQASHLIKFLATIPLANAFYFMMTTGYEFAESQKMRPLITFCGLLTVIVSANLLIDIFAIPGASFSIALGWIVMAIFTYHQASRIYTINYDWIKVFLILFSTIILSWIPSYFNGGFLLDLLIVLVYLILLKLTIFKNITIDMVLHLIKNKKIKS